MVNTTVQQFLRRVATRVLSVCRIICIANWVFYPKSFRNNVILLAQRIVYLIRCRVCDVWYIGETSQKLHLRMNGHRNSISTSKNLRSGVAGLPVGDHFSKPGHSNDDMIVSVLKGNLVNLRERRRTELELIRLFKTKSNGLNSDISFLSHYNVNDY